MDSIDVLVVHPMWASVCTLPVKEKLLELMKATGKIYVWISAGSDASAIAFWGTPPWTYSGVAALDVKFALETSIPCDWSGWMVPDTPLLCLCFTQTVSPPCPLGITITPPGDADPDYASVFADARKLVMVSFRQSDPQTASPESLEYFRGGKGCTGLRATVFGPRQRGWVALLPPPTTDPEPDPRPPTLASYLS